MGNLVRTGRQLLVFVALYVAYVGFYITRKNYPFLLASLVEQRGVPESEAGMLGSALELSSSVCKLLGGGLVDASPWSLLLGGSLLATALANVVIATTTVFSVMLAAWACNGVFQAFGWPALARIFLEWFPEPATRGTMYAILSTNQNVGAALPALALGPLMAMYGWRAALWGPAAAGGVLAVLVLVLVSDRPSPQELAAITNQPIADQNSRQRPATAGSAAAAAASAGQSGSLSDVLASPAMWLLGCGYLCVSLLRAGVQDWAVVMLTTHMRLSAGQAGSCLLWLEVGGVVGGLAAGWLSDTTFAGRRGPVMAVFCALAVPACLALSLPGVLQAAAGQWALVAAAAWGSAPDDPVATAVLPAVYLLIGIASFAPHMLVGLASREWVPKDVSSTAGGFTKALAQIGGALAGAPLVLAIEATGGWQSAGFFYASCAVGGAACFLPLWGKRAAEHAKQA